MLSKEILRHIVTNTDIQNKDDLLTEFLFNLNEKYSNNKLEYVLSILINPNNAITKDDIDMEYIQNNMDKFIFNNNFYKCSKISLKEINNIKCSITIEYKFIIKGEDKTLKTEETTISFVDYKEVIKKN